MSGATLHGARFESTETMVIGSSRPVSVKGTIFDDADLQWAFFIDVVLNDSSFAGAKLNSAWFIGVDFSGARGLESVTHWGPSVIDTRSLSRSAGRIADVFLRGCGVPDPFIT